MRVISILLALVFGSYLADLASSQIEQPSAKMPQIQVDPSNRSQDQARTVKTSDSNDEARKFAQSVIERNMDQLFEAISEFDRGNFNLIYQIGMSSL